MIDLQIFPPGEALKEIVSNYFVARVSDKDDLPFTIEVFLMNIPALNFLNTPGIFKYDSLDGSMKESPMIALVGQMSKSRMNIFLKPGIIITVIFTPWGLYKMSGLNMSELTDSTIDPCDIIGKNELEKCRIALFNSCSLKVALDILHSYLCKWSKDREYDLRQIDKMSSLINSMKGNVNIDWLIREANMSLKTFERHFSEKIGLQPKLFSRISRFSHAVKMLQAKADIFSIINECGFTDQAHFIKECKSLCGNTPKFYLKESENISRFFFSQFVKD